MIAMAHRGRLNVLAHVMQKPYAQILAEFKDPLFARSSRIDLGWMGDVKYHAGARVEQPDRPDIAASSPCRPTRAISRPSTRCWWAWRAPRPPVVDAPGAPTLRTNEVLGILIHGDAAFPGQGVVAETLNLSRLAGWDVGGTIHIIANNQLGFTAEPQESFTTSYASGLARGFKIPIVHVNADDPVACIEAARLAWAYRHRFELDFLIDLVGYRRYGHNEGDEPAFTQPLMYQRVAEHPTVREQYAARARGRAGRCRPRCPTSSCRARAPCSNRPTPACKPEEDYVPEVPVVPPSGAAARVQTAVPLDALDARSTRRWRRCRTASPCTGSSNAAASARSTMLDEPDERTIDWAAAEELALASILADGIAIRLTGEDVERGTFSQRHAVLHDAVTGDRHVPLQALPQAQGVLRDPQQRAVRNCRDRLRVRLQHAGAAAAGAVGGAVRRLHQRRAGDARRVPHVGPREVGPGAVARAAAAARLRGPGPGSLERAARALPATRPPTSTCASPTARPPRSTSTCCAARRCCSSTDPLPLVVLTPKSLLRHPLVASTPRELAEGRFQLVIDDDRRRRAPPRCGALVLCSGKVYVDLVASEQRKASAGVALVASSSSIPSRPSSSAPLLARYPKLQRSVLGAGRAGEHGRLGVRAARCSRS